MRLYGPLCGALASLAAGCLDAPPGAGVGGAPSAAFGSQATFLDVIFDASSSSDPDGVIDSYAWSFGDASTGTGVAQVHHYEVPGTYRVELTVTDDEGNTDSIVNDVAVEDTPLPVAADTFERAVADGWANADVGGAWEYSNASGFSVDGASGAILLAPGTERNAHLDAVSSLSHDLTGVFSSDEAGTGGGIYVRFVGRRVADAAYHLAIGLRVDGVVDAKLEVVTPAVNLAGPIDLPNQDFQPGDILAVRLQVAGDEPTTLRARVWPATEPEPIDWLLEATDDTPILQDAGDVGVGAYLSASATTAPVTVTVDDFLVRPLE